MRRPFRIPLFTAASLRAPAARAAVFSHPAFYGGEPPRPGGPCGGLFAGGIFLFGGRINAGGVQILMLSAAVSGSARSQGKYFARKKIKEKGPRLYKVFPIKSFRESLYDGKSFRESLYDGKSFRERYRRFPIQSPFSQSGGSRRRVRPRYGEQIWESLLAVNFAARPSAVRPDGKKPKKRKIA